MLNDTVRRLTAHRGAPACADVGVVRRCGWTTAEMRVQVNVASINAALVDYELF